MNNTLAPSYPPAKVQQVVPHAQPPTPTDLLDRALVQGASVEVLEKLMGLQERYDANMARRAFDNAMAEAKANMPVIFKSREMNAGQGRTTYKFEDMAAISKAVDPVLAEHGLSYRFRTQSGEGNVTVTCIISHRDGHSEENSLTSGFDTSGSKNTIQSLGSAVTYLSRYTLKAALGLAASQDDDAQSFGRGNIEPEQVEQLLVLIADIGGKQAPALKKGFLKRMGVSDLVEIPSAKFKDACDILEAKRGTI